jgi:hypothetical protein
MCPQLFAEPPTPPQIGIHFLPQQAFALSRLAGADCLAAEVRSCELFAVSQ